MLPSSSWLESKVKQKTSMKQGAGKFFQETLVAIFQKI
jgi:hypothetical protein